MGALHGSGRGAGFGSRAGDAAKDLILYDRDRYLLVVIPASQRLDLGKVREEVDQAGLVVQELPGGRSGFCSFSGEAQLVHLVSTLSRSSI